MDDFKLRPLHVTFLVLFVLCITVWNALRALSAIGNWDTLREFGANPAYIFISGLVWAVASFWLSYRVWAGHPSAFRAGLALSGLYFVWYWLDRLFIQSAPAPNVLFSVFVSGLYLLYVIIGLIASKTYLDKE